MGALPKRKISKQRKGKRRAAISLGAVNVTKCKNCDQPKQPHQACSNCGTYK